MIVIQQAIYGEVPGKTSGHGLLTASIEKNELFRRLSGHTDLADRPEEGVLSAPVLRGFFAEDHFLLIKTFPDKRPGLRSGRVFSHALFIRRADLHQIRNFKNLFRYHLASIQKEAEMLPLEYHPQRNNATNELLSGREAAGTNALLQNEPFVWKTEEGYWEWITRIWPQLSTQIKQKLKIGAAFSPSYAKKELLNLIYIPEDTKTLWERHKFRVIDNLDDETLESEAAYWLVGNVEKGEPFQTLLKDFDPNIDSISLLNRLQSHGSVYHRLEQVTNLRHLLVLSHFISRVNPKEKTGTRGKSKLLTTILKVLPRATLQEIKALIDQTWIGFSGAKALVSDAVNDWLSTHLFQKKHAKEGGSLIVKAVEAETKNWWSEIVLEYATERLRIRQPSDASILWQWMKNNPVLITHHESWLPDNTENELIKKIPRLKTEVAKAVLIMAKQKEWLVMHAKMAALCYSAEKAIEAQLFIDTDVNYAIAFQALSESLEASSFVSVAVVHKDQRLYDIAGKLIAENSKLFKGINIAMEGWQRCWEAAIEQGSEVWSGITDPQQTLFEVLDLLLNENWVSNKLLQAMSTGKYCSLKDHHKRASVWQELPLKARSGFITGTLVELIDDLTTEKLHYKDLEAELKKEAESQDFQQHVISSNNISLSKKLKLFDVLPGLGKYHAQQLIKAHRFSQVDAEKFGRLIFSNNWSEVAYELYDNRSSRNDLNPALSKCIHFFGFFERLALKFNGLETEVFSEGEWWNALTEEAFQTYPEGPNERGLWGRAGGDLSQLNLGATGREVWVNAIRIVKNDGNPTVENLISTMLEDHSYNEMLLKLKGTL